MAQEHSPRKVAFIDCSGDPNYPEATARDWYVVSVAGQIGGGSGTVVGVGAILVCLADTIGGTQAAVGSSWKVITDSSVLSNLVISDSLDSTKRIVFDQADQTTGTDVDILTSLVTASVNQFVSPYGGTFVMGTQSLHIQEKFCTTEFDVDSGTTGATLANIVGLTGFTLVAGATYQFEGNIDTECTTNGGIKLAFKYTTATLTSLAAAAQVTAAASTAYTRTTTATDQASIVESKAAAWLNVRLSGRIVVNAAGTLALQAAQETAHGDNTKVFVGSWLRLIRTA